MAQRRPESDQSSAAYVASARRINVGGGTAQPQPGESMGLAKPDERQRQSWLYFDAIPEVKQATYFLANTMSLVRLYVAVQVDEEQEPQAPEPGMAGAYEAGEALGRLRQGNGGHGWFMRGGTLNLCVPGEFYLVGYPEQQAREPNPRNPKDQGVPMQPERWRVHSTSELVKDGDSPRAPTLVKASPKDKGTQLPPDTFVLRIWQEHPEYSELADSALLGALAECEELVILSRVVRATGRSRLAGNGILVVPNEMTIKKGGAQNPSDPTADEFNDLLMDAMITPIGDEGNPSAVVPLVLRGPAEHIDKVKHFHMDRPFDAEARAGRGELLERLGSGLDIPIEVLTGIGKVNHWGAWQIDQMTWTRYGQPKAVVLCEALTAGYLRPYLEEAGLAPEVAAQFVVWFDPGGAISDPDMTASAMEAHDRFVISDSAYRNAVGFSDADAPDDAEIQARIERAIAIKASTGAGNDVGAPNNGTPPSGPQSRLVRMARRVLGRPEATMAAAMGANAPLGVRLAALDRGLRMRIDEAAQNAMMRTLERAGARVRNKAAKVAALREMVSHEPAHTVCRVLGSHVVNASLALTDADLLQGGFDQLHARFDKKVAEAQAQVRAMLANEYELTDSELAELQREQDQDRHAAWVWFAAALTALAAQRLYSEAPVGEQVGEYDVTALVPPGLVREALARAGGADDVAAAGHAGVGAAPPGGVGLGQLVRDVWQQHGQVVAGWTWLYGDPSSRGHVFPNHEALDGTTFATWDDPVLAVQDEDGWLGVDYYRPGDHPWCQCDFAPDLASSADAGADSDTLVGAE